MTATPKWDTIAIVGVGLIGGSIGLALRQRGLCRQVVGIGRRAVSLRAARRRAAITSATTDIARGVADADLVVICTPVEHVIDHARQVLTHCRPDALVTDAASTKARIVTEIEALHASGRPALRGRFVGSHPMAGSEKSGVRFAEGDLFVDRAVIVTPGPTSRPRDVAAIVRFWRALGGRVTRQSPDVHDAAVAAISHLPHVVASVLAAATPPEHLPLVAGGWRDTTRVAAGAPDLWRQIMLDNRDQILESLERFSVLLSEFRAALDAGNVQSLLRLLEKGKTIRDAVGN